MDRFLLIFFSLFLGGGGLEVRRNGAGPPFPLDIHVSLYHRHWHYNPERAIVVRHHETD